MGITGWWERLILAVGFVQVLVAGFLTGLVLGHVVVKALGVLGN